MERSSQDTGRVGEGQRAELSLGSHGSTVTHLFQRFPVCFSAPGRFGNLSLSGCYFLLHKEIRNVIQLSTTIMDQEYLRGTGILFSTSARKF